ncbi:hypothetical protein LRS13_16895 [Svornostia abyssi]|uniref:DUF4350 domain-containing protein n=1 Tax=Svornostia abyssi TaxID=2898438 RepID=A0ABY5PCG4_9ACTN|nr:hypothetical protein LRS13_16895 [Parviterribacteraceae bacterium J379]
MRIAAIAVVVVALVAIGGFGLSTFVNGRDSASVSTGSGPGSPRGAAEDALGAAGDVGVAGNVVLLHAAEADGPALRALGDEVAGPASPELEEAGQAVIVRQTPDAEGVIALSDTRVLRADSAADPQIRAFVESSLGTTGTD